MSTNVAVLLRDARLSAGLTQGELAERARTSQPAVAAYESGRRTPVLSTLSRLLAACGREVVLDTRSMDAGGAQDVVAESRAKLIDAALALGVTNVRVFGSTARDDTTASSDVDLLVDLLPGRTLIDLAAFRADAEAILGVAVDVATLDLLKEHIRDDVTRDARPI